jgi:plasmid maintenance system antidote protein VapI
MKVTEGSVRLAAFLERQGFSTGSFAALIGANRSQIYRLCKGDRGPSVDLAARIEQETGGEIRAADWTVPPRRRGRRAH